MGKGVILADNGDGTYSVEIQLNTTRAVNRLNSMIIAVVFADLVAIPAAETVLAAAQSDAETADAALNAAINGGDSDVIKIATKVRNAANRAVEAAEPK